ncbi:MAG: hypothetical protein VX741_04505 [Pseudomonadota bacterium]|nr:hypothetical protein [Pseudomonadota bacterium]
MDLPDFDTPALIEDPYPAYRELRETEQTKFIHNILPIAGLGITLSPSFFDAG